MLPLTHQERKVVTFVLCLVLLGMGIDFIKKKTNRVSLINYEKLKDRFFDKIDINRATFSQLISIPGIGETFARRILAYRRQYGDFEDVEELVRVKGIGRKKLEQLKKYSTVSKDAK